MIKSNKHKILIFLGVIILIINLVSCTEKTYLNWFTAQQIYQDYIDLHCKDDPNFKRKDFYVEYYVGKYNGYRILMFSLTDKKYVNMPYLDKIGDVFISYSNSKRLIAHKNGEFYTLQELFENEELTEKEINKIRITFNHLRYH